MHLVKFPNCLYQIIAVGFLSCCFVLVSESSCFVQGLRVKDNSVNVWVSDSSACVSARGKDRADSRMACSVGGDSHFTSDYHSLAHKTRAHIDSITISLLYFIQDLSALYFPLSRTHRHRHTRSSPTEKAASHTEQPDNSSVNQRQGPA